MPRFYVKKPDALPCEQWNIFSTIVDDFLLPEWCSFGELVKYVLDETIEERIGELSTLLTDKPKVNVMSYEEALERKCEESEEDD